MYGAFSSRYPAARQYLDDSVVAHKWARCCFLGQKYNIDTTNSAKSINDMFRDARKYDLLPLIDAIVEKVSEWFNRHREEADTISVGQMLVLVVERIENARKLIVTKLNSLDLEFNITGKHGKKYLVNLEKKSCSCKRFDIDKYPCDHGIAATMNDLKRTFKLYELCANYFLVKEWSLAYKRTIHLVPHQSQWKVLDGIKAKSLLPPSYTPKSGRRKEKRYTSTGEHGCNKKKKQKRSSLFDYLRSDDNRTI